MMAARRRAAQLLPLALLALAAGAGAELLASNSTASETQCGGDEQPGSFCFVASSTFPRECTCVRNVCPASSIAETTNCFICDRGGDRRPPARLPPAAGRRSLPCMPSTSLLTLPLPTPSPPSGYGTYPSLEECMAGEAEVQASGIDPDDYPSPAVAQTQCPARSRATGAVSSVLSAAAAAVGWLLSQLPACLPAC